MVDIPTSHGATTVLERTADAPTVAPGSAPEADGTVRVRTGQDYLDDLRDGRVVFLDGEPVADVVDDFRFEGITRTVAEMFDHAADPVNGMRCEDTATDGAVLWPYAIPRTAEQFAARRTAIQRWSQLTGGFVGRSPDHVAGLFAGFAAGADVFRREGFDGAGNVQRWHRKIAAGSKFVSYAITPPQSSRIPSDDDTPDQPLQVAVVGRDAQGITLRGAQMLATSGAVADLLFVSCIQPLGPGDADHAFSVMVPVNARGLRLYCRRPYASRSDDGYDYPLTSRFDESDAVVVFDEVFVPWDDVFVCQDVDGVREQFYLTPAHALSNHQAQLRLVEKLAFVLGVARKVCAAHGTDTTPAVIEKLGELASLASMVEAATIAAESRGAIDAHGVFVPERQFLYGAMGLQSEIYPRVIQIMRELVGGGVIQMPSSRHEMLNADTRADLTRYARAKGASADDRVQLLKLAWDIVGSEFAGRHVQYEIFYAGPPFVARMMAYRHYDFGAAVDTVDGFLATYSAEDPAGDATRAESATRG